MEGKVRRSLILLTWLNFSPITSKTPAGQTNNVVAFKWASGQVASDQLR